MKKNNMLNKPKIEVEAKIYSIVIEFEDTSFLSVQLAYSLEEAFILAKLELERLEKEMFVNGQPKISDGGNPRIGMFICKSLNEFNQPINNGGTIRETRSEQELIKNAVKVIKKSTVKKVTVINKKNNLMKLILSNKDKTLLKKNLNFFTKSEITYLKERIK